MYELFTGRPFFGEAVTYSTVAALTGEGAGAEAVRLRVRQHSLASVSDAHLRLITSMLAPAGNRPSAAELLLKSCFRAADDTVERRRLEVSSLHQAPHRRPPPHCALHPLSLAFTVELLTYIPDPTLVISLLRAPHQPAPLYPAAHLPPSSRSQ
jgi:hypothetical protein